MSADVIRKIFSSDQYISKWFCGFSTPDLPLSKQMKKPSLYVLNTDKSTGPGEHWCIVIFFENGLCEFFDSNGFSPNIYKFDKPFLKLAKHVEYNNLRVQSITSSTCGHHCIFFAVHRSRGISMQDIMKKYAPFNLMENDKMVYDFVQKHYGNTFAQIH